MSGGGADCGGGGERPQASGGGGGRGWWAPRRRAWHSSQLPWRYLPEDDDDGTFSKSFSSSHRISVHFHRPRESASAGGLRAPGQPAVGRGIRPGRGGRCRHQRPGRGVPSPPPPSPCPPTLPQGRRLQHPRLPRAAVTPATCPALRRARAGCCQRGRSRWVRRRRRPSPRPCATAWPILLRRRRAWHPRLLFGAVACARTRVTRSSHGRRRPPPPLIPMVGAAWHGMAPCGTEAAAVDAWSAMAGCATRGHRGSSGQATVGGGCRRAASGGGHSCA